MIVVGPVGLVIVIGLILLVAVGRLTIWDAIGAFVVIVGIVYLLRLVDP